MQVGKAGKGNRRAAGGSKNETVLRIKMLKEA
jgi:hypothetical protein